MKMEKDDSESVMDQVALECMNAIETKDKESFKDAFHVLVCDVVGKMMGDKEGDES